MAARSGRKLLIRRGSTPVAKQTTGSVTINNEMVDITNKTDGEWRLLLADVGVRNVSLTCEGVLDDAVFIAIAVGAASSLLENYTVLIDGLGTFSGNFMLTNLTLPADQADGIRQTLALESSGAITWTAA